MSAIEDLRREVADLTALVHSVVPHRSRPDSDFGARLRGVRTARRWSQAEAVRRLRGHVASGAWPSGDEVVVRSWKRWESGRNVPRGVYRAGLESLFGAGELGGAGSAVVPASGRSEGR
ncbi:hypothetical protein OG921_26245 [Aldersonia sp. NBC_00410]|uniref:hypothetical protein n=1 Tax=Aldersonia sp. NBC_00410 TaxID=2975954 RepID=UPI00225BB3D3|nr:hypothetical protein [Aldersonia sp. NBC_00410]MCX5046680.1 hypothetical protein [Aldersonia sp. NBC_00410]